MVHQRSFGLCFLLLFISTPIRVQSVLKRHIFVWFMAFYDNNWLKISIIQLKILPLHSLREKSQIEKRYCFYLWKTKSGKFGRRVKRQRRSSCRIYLQGCPCCILRLTIWRGFICYFSFLHRFFQSLYSRWLSDKVLTPFFLYTLKNTEFGDL